MVQGAATGDVDVIRPREGKRKVILPVGLPDEGTFEWLDAWHRKNPGYMELSDRKILEWAQSSGLWKNKTTNWKHSNDKPDFNYGLPSMDDGSVRRVLHTVAPLVPRDYV